VRTPPAPAGPNTVDSLLHWEMRALPAQAWCWIGPFGDTTNPPTKYPTDNFATTSYPAEKALTGLTPDSITWNGSTLRWQAVTGDTPWVDFAQLCGLKDRGINYAATRIWAEKAGPRTVRLTVDYYAKLWLNGQLVKTIDTAHGGGRNPIMLSLDFRTGWNDLLIKVESGSQGNNLSLTMVGDNRGVKFANPLTQKEE
jgi:hypothetical protein